MAEQDRGPVLHRAADAAALADDLADFIVQRLAQALAARGTALLVLSGGTTPVPVFQRLSRASLAWDRVQVTLADERWVPPDHPASNARLVAEHLLQGAAAGARFEPLYNGAPTPQDGEADAETRLDALCWPADVVVLGMGGDGHTASWFPGRPVPATAEGRRCLAVDMPPPPNVQHTRLTLTPAALLKAGTLILHLTGADKEPLLGRALLPEGDALQLPVRRALHDASTPCHVFYAP